MIDNPTPEACDTDELVEPVAWLVRYGDDSEVYTDHSTATQVFGSVAPATIESLVPLSTLTSLRAERDALTMQLQQSTSTIRTQWKSRDRAESSLAAEKRETARLSKLWIDATREGEALQKQVAVWAQLASDYDTDKKQRVAALEGALTNARTTLDELWEHHLHNTEAGCEAWADVGGAGTIHLIDAALRPRGSRHEGR